MSEVAAGLAVGALTEPILLFGTGYGIDHLLLDACLADRLERAGVDRKVRGGGRTQRSCSSLDRAEVKHGGGLASAPWTSPPVITTAGAYNPHKKSWLAN